MTDFEEIKNILCEWVKDKPFIKKVYIYGSYVMGCNHPNDIDVAIEICCGLETPLTTWVCEQKKLSEDLHGRSNKYKFHLELYEPNITPTVKKGLEQGNILVYSRDFNDSNKPTT